MVLSVCMKDFRPRSKVTPGLSESLPYQNRQFSLHLYKYFIFILNFAFGILPIIFKKKCECTEEMSICDKSNFDFDWSNLFVHTDVYMCAMHAQANCDYFSSKLVVTQKCIYTTRVITK